MNKSQTNSGLSESALLKQQADQIANLAEIGVSPSVDPEVADHMGCFEETALSLEDAEESVFDGPENDQGDNGETSS